MNSKNNRRKTVRTCNPPYDCLSGNCPYPDDCHRGNKAITKAEIEYRNVSGISDGRHKCDFTMVSDIIHSRPGGRRII